MSIIETPSSDRDPQNSHLKLVDQPPGHTERIEAERAAEEEARLVWQKKLHTSGKKGAPRKILANAMVPLRHASEWKGVLRYNESSLLVIVDKPLPWIKDKGEREAWKSRPWTDQDDRLWAEWLQVRQIDVSIALAAEAVQAVARQDHAFHPIREYLEGLKWDGQLRLDRWLVTYAGAEDTPYHRMVGVKWPLSGVARVMEPGTSADYILQLEGIQGLGKTRLIRAFAVRPEWFTDEVRDVGGRDAAMALAGKWIIEFAELAAFQGNSDEKLKAFISRRVDRYRPPWGRGMGDFPRQCIFASTTNRHETLTDASGNRRYWPVECTKIDVEGMERDRDQLWAEAFHLYKEGVKWWPTTPEEIGLASEAQDVRFETDPIETAVKEFCRFKAEVTVKEILMEVLDKEVKDFQRRDQIRVGRILDHLKWVRGRNWSATGSYVGEKVFRRPESWGEVPEKPKQGNIILKNKDGEKVKNSAGS